MSSDFLIDCILPKREISLVAGPSGAGKTRWLLHTLKHEWEKGLPVLGYESFPEKWVYIASDRSEASVNRTMTDIGIDPKTINIIPAWGKHRKTLAQIFDAIKDSGAKLAVIEGFGGYAEEGTPSAVRHHLSTVQHMLESEDVTVIGVVESPKMKPRDVYENPRQRVSGAAAWAHYTETIFLVEPTEVANPKLPSRRLIVCPRNAAGMILQSAFDNQGRLRFEVTFESAEVQERR